MPAMAEAACAYDMDQIDEAWLKIMNENRSMAGNANISEEHFERVVEELEVNMIKNCLNETKLNVFLDYFFSPNRTDVGTKYRPL